MGVIVLVLLLKGRAVVPLSAFLLGFEGDLLLGDLLDLLQLVDFLFLLGPVSGLLIGGSL